MFLGLLFECLLSQFVMLGLQHLAIELVHINQRETIQMEENVIVDRQLVCEQFTIELN